MALHFCTAECARLGHCAMGGSPTPIYIPFLTDYVGKHR